MTPRQIKNRTVFIEATKQTERAKVKKYSRRDNNVLMEDENHPNEKFDSFFDFEEDLSDLKPSSEQFQESESFVMEEVEEKKIESVFTVMEDIDEKPNLASPITLEEFDSEEKEKNTIIKEDSMKCSKILKNGNRCKINKVKDSIYCGIHRAKITKS